MVTVYESGRAFLEEAESAMLNQEAIFQNILVNARKNADRKADQNFCFGTVRIAGEPVLTFCNCHPWNLTVGCVLPQQEKIGGKIVPIRTRKEKIEEAAAELAAYLKEEGIPLKGIHANGTVCMAFLTKYGSLAVKYLSMDIMVCRRLKEVPFCEGIYRSAQEEDMQWLLEGCVAFEKDALGTDGDRELYREDIKKHQLPEDRVRLFCLPDNTPVCMVKRCRELKYGFGLNQVYTLPTYRGKGYAQTLVYKACEEFLKDGYSFATLYVDKTNPVSNRVYQKVGFEIVEEAYDYHFTEDAKK